ncbi:MAG: 4Fe-4S binding protein, partial [Candidatus Riflebacteria bacterium]|nr:4Fe-4S binding protein [Candidatus Riflebacteria bacterium]
MHDTETNPAPGGRSSSPVGRVRMVMQVTFVVATAVVGFRMAMGWSLTSVEKYCPFGGLEAAYAYFTNQRFICAVGETNLSLFLALLGLTFLARKAFCSWVCPLGAVNEWTWALGRWWRNRPGQTGSGATSWCLEPSPPVDRALRWLRLPVLAVILYFTCKTGELIFRGFDPYYIVFCFHGHDVKAWSYAILALV